MTSSTQQPLSWTPLSTSNTIDKNSVYAVSLEDIDIHVTALTPFVDMGLRVQISGLRLFHLLKNGAVVIDNNTANVASASATQRKKNLKNVCFKNIIHKSEVIKTFTTKLCMPDCMQRFLNEFAARPRGKRYRKRFIFNSYIANVLTCTKCNKGCLVTAMSVLYEQENKCVQEFDCLLFKRDKVYLPPNCVNMKTKDKLCFKTGNCKGTNPVCNY
jgi:lef-2